jgi:hypothetical protein
MARRVLKAYRNCTLSGLSGQASGDFRGSGFYFGHFGEIEQFKDPFVVSLSNHAFGGLTDEQHHPTALRRAWFDGLTTNGFWAPEAEFR